MNDNKKKENSATEAPKKSFKVKLQEEKAKVSKDIYAFQHRKDTKEEQERLAKLRQHSEELKADLTKQSALWHEDEKALAVVRSAHQNRAKKMELEHKAALLKHKGDEKALAAENEAYKAKLAEEKKVYDAEALAAAPNAKEHLKAVETDKDYLKLSSVGYKQELVDNNIILSLRHVKQFFNMGGGDKTKAVHDVSFDVHTNECFGLVGESGCGKTTTGRCIIKLYDITSGAIYYKGYRISGGTRFNLKEIKWSRIHTNEKIAKLKEKEDLEIKSIPLKSLDFEAKIQDLDAQEASEIKEKDDPNDVDREDLIASIHQDYAKRRAELSALKEAASGTEEEQAKKVKAYYEGEIKALREAEAVHIREQREEIAHIRYDNRHANSLRLPDEVPEGTNMAEVKSQPNHRLVNEIQMIFQDPVDSLDPRMTVNDIIQEGLHIQGHLNKAENERIVAQTLDKVGLIPEYASRYPHEFSGGQRQRIGIARALVMNPKFLICDEPISALDVSIRAQILNLLNDVKEEMGVTILFIAHDLSVVKYFCDRIAVMYYGNMVELASSDELFKHPLHPYTKSLLSAIPKPDPASEKNRIRIVYKPSEVHDYSKEKPSFQEILPGHWVLANAPEMVKYRQEIASIDEKAAAVTAPKKD
jgi:oligopeptide transport system ATP-binding protein